MLSEVGVCVILGPEAGCLTGRGLNRSCCSFFLWAFYRLVFKLLNCRLALIDHSESSLSSLDVMLFFEQRARSGANVLLHQCL